MDNKAISQHVAFDPTLDQAINEYLDQVIEEEKRDFQQKLEPFDTHAQKIRTKISDALNDYQRTYENGYRILCSEIKKTLPNATSDGDPFAPYQINEECRKILDDSSAFVDFLSQERPLYELLGFTNSTVETFYEAACQILEEKRFQEAKDAFFFLVTIAPQLSQCWLGLGYCYLQCQDFEPAQLACSRALDLDPSNPDNYLTFSRIFIVMNDFENASQICELGLVHAAENKGEPWSEELAMTMEEAKHYIQSMKG